MWSPEVIGDNAYENKITASSLKNIVAKNEQSSTKEADQLSTMQLSFNLLILSFTLMSVSTQSVQDGCPKNEYACLDVINSSQCIEQLVIEKLAPATKEALVKCVEYEGTITRLPGASKVSSPEKIFANGNIEP